MNCLTRRIEITIDEDINRPVRWIIFLLRKALTEGAVESNFRHKDIKKCENADLKLTTNPVVS